MSSVVRTALTPQDLILRSFAMLPGCLSQLFPPSPPSPGGSLHSYDPYHIYGMFIRLGQLPVPSSATPYPASCPPTHHPAQCHRCSSASDSNRTRHSLMASLSVTLGLGRTSVAPRSTLAGDTAELLGAVTAWA